MLMSTNKSSAERFVREEKAHEMLEGIRNLRCE